jgi:PEGA domain
MKRARDLTHDVPSGAPPTQPDLASWYAPGLSDALGDRLLMFDNTSAPSLELLRIRPELTDTPGFEEALRERVRSLQHFRHPSFARVRAVERLEPDDGLALVSNHTPGRRLSEVLRQARGPAFASALLRQLTPALAMLQQQAAGISHGALDLDRIVVAPDGQLVIVEHVLGSALETLPPNRLMQLGIAVLPTGHVPSRFEGRTDFFQLGLVAVSLLAGRRVSLTEYPQVERLLDQVAQSAPHDPDAHLPFLRHWIARALELDGGSFESGSDALEALHGLAYEREDERKRLLVLEAASPIATAEPTRMTPVAAEQGEVAPARASEQVIVDPVHPAPEEPRQTLPPPVDAPVFADRADSARPAARVETSIRAVPTVTPFPGTANWRRPVEPVIETAKPKPAARPVQPHARDRHDAPAPQARPARARDRAAARQEKPRQSRRKMGAGRMIAALTLLAAAEGGVIAALLYRGWPAPHQSIVVETADPGASVVVDGRSVGVTPLQLTVGTGTTSIRIASAGRGPANTGDRATSGATRGVPGKNDTPASDRAASRTPQRTAGIRLTSPIDVEVFDGNHLVGSGPGKPLSLTPGRHELSLVNTSVGYRGRRTVDVKAGQVVNVEVSPPAGRVSINAVPWAEVSVDGKRVGETPLGNLAVPVGEREFTFRHPQLGERRQKAIVRADGVTRVTADLQR